MYVCIVDPQDEIRAAEGSNQWALSLRGGFLISDWIAELLMSNVYEVAHFPTLFSSPVLLAN